MSFPYTLTDLTHSLSSAIPTWEDGCGFEHRLHFDYLPHASYNFRTYKIFMYEGIGTHMDAPAHCIPGGKTIDELDLKDLVSPCVVIDISHKADESYSLSVEDTSDFETIHCIIQPTSFVIINTGWSRFWHEPEKYRNGLKFPSISKEAAEHLLEREITGLGIDTLSPDRPDDGYPVHAAILGAGKYIVENITNADKLPAIGSYIMVLPMKISNGTEAPIRLIGLLQKDL